MSPRSCFTLKFWALDCHIALADLARARDLIALGDSPPLSQPVTIYIDADACPVKQEIYRVAERHALKGIALKVLVVSNSPIAVPRDIFVGGRPDAKPGSTFAGRPLIERVVVGAGMDEADNWIVERAQRGDIVITADVPLASCETVAIPFGRAHD